MWRIVYINYSYRIVHRHKDKREWYVFYSEEMSVNLCSFCWFKAPKNKVTQLLLLENPPKYDYTDYINGPLELVNGVHWVSRPKLKNKD